jgi:hypothetical protein
VNNITEDILLNKLKSFVEYKEWIRNESAIIEDTNPFIIRYRKQPPYYSSYQSIRKKITINYVDTMDEVELNICIEPWEKKEHIDILEAKKYWVDFIYELIEYISKDSLNREISKLYSEDLLVERINIIKKQGHKLNEVIIIGFGLIGIITIFLLYVFRIEIKFSDIIGFLLILTIGGIFVKILGTLQYNRDIKKMKKIMEEYPLYH